MSTMYFYKSFYQSIASNIAYVSKQHTSVLNEVLGEYKSIQHFLNDCSKANLHSWRERYPNANRYRHQKLPASAVIKPEEISLSELIKVLSRLEYNIDMDCLANDILESLIVELQLLFVQMCPVNTQLADFVKSDCLNEYGISNNGFSMLHQVFEALRYSPLAHSTETLKAINHDGYLCGFSNMNNRVFNGLFRLTGYIRAQTLRSLGCPAKEKFVAANNFELKKHTLNQQVVIGLKVLATVLPVIHGKAYDVVKRIFDLLIDDLLHNRNAYYHELRKF